MKENPLINHTFSTGEAFTLQKTHSESRKNTHNAESSVKKGVEKSIQ